MSRAAAVAARAARSPVHPGPHAGEEGSAGTWAGHWAELAAAALLGTDRRPPPPPLPGALAALGGDTSADPSGGEAVEPPDDATRLLDQVALVTAARRAGVRPGSAPAPLAACPADPTPTTCPPAATRRLAELLEAWPVLVDEWLVELVAAGYRLPAEHIVPLLARFRADPRRRARVAEAAGPRAEWLTELFPELLAPRRPGRAAPAQAAVDAEGSPPLPPDLAPLLALEPDRLLSALADGVDQGRWSHRHRSLLVRLVVSVAPAALAVLADGLAASASSGPFPGRARGAVDLLGDLAVLARTRAGMLAELAPPAGSRP
jgi:hypothetical protein